jgi:D-sedoheptulose 7-phosphate isomerase
MNKKKLMQHTFENSFKKSILVKQKCLEKGFDDLENIAKTIISSLKNNGKLMVCGNGGSAADAQHLAAELLVRLKSDSNRGPIPAISLALDSSTMTACGNDFSFDYVYERNVRALGNENDCLLVISTSGNSKNLILAINAAKRNKIKVCALLGKDGGECAKLSDYSFIVPSIDTAAIQEAHIVAGHALMEIIENNVGSK